MLRFSIFFFQAEDGIRGLERSRGLGEVYKGQGNVRGGSLVERSRLFGQKLCEPPDVLPSCVSLIRMVMEEMRAPTDGTSPRTPQTVALPGGVRGPALDTMSRLLTTIAPPPRPLPSKSPPLPVPYPPTPPTANSTHLHFHHPPTPIPITHPLHHPTICTPFTTLHCTSLSMTSIH